MQHKYSEEFKETVIKKMMSPNPVSVSQRVKETGVSDVTLYKWRKDYTNRGIAVPENPAKQVHELTPRLWKEKFAGNSLTSELDGQGQ